MKILSEPKLVFIWCLIATFIITTLFILLSTVIIRARKNKKIILSKKLSEKYQTYLSELASGNYEDNILEIMSVKKEETLALDFDDIKKPFNRQILLRDILSLHLELSGEAAIKLRESYLTLGFKKESIKKLKNKNWGVRVEGIKEINQMDIKDGYQPLFDLINDRHPLVRLEAILSRIKMDVNPFGFFKELKTELNEWEQLRIHNAFQRLPLEQVPDFSTLLNHPSKSIKLFAIKMVGYFNQSDAEVKLLNRLTGNASELNFAILESLKSIGSESTVVFIHEMYNSAVMELKVKLIETLATLSSVEEVDFLKEQFSIEDYDINMAAASALIRLKVKITDNDDKRISKIIQHVNEWHK